nr:MAG TPA: hypothetical protein [Caudoviricetes sp.]DAZ16836.1 MAG TPA: hypothetical protein [Caudoviricetes sp.]
MYFLLNCGIIEMEEINYIFRHIIYSLILKEMNVCRARMKDLVILCL